MGQPADALACLEEEAVYAHQQAHPAVRLRAQQRSSNGGSADGGDGAIDDGPRILVEVVEGGSVTIERAFSSSLTVRAERAKFCPRRGRALPRPLLSVRSAHGRALRSGGDRSSVH